MSPTIPYGKQTINSEDIKLVTKVLKSDYLTTGPFVEKFENSFKKKVNSKYAISCSNGTSALHLSMLAIGLKKNDVVIMPTINFIASANMSRLLNAKIYLADVDSSTGQLTKKTINECIKKNKIRTLKLILIMHHGGSPNLGSDLSFFKRKYKCFIIEDACHALGGKYSIKKNIKVGSCKFSDISTFSFHPVKSITTAEGGMITTSDKKIYQKIKILRNHGMIRNKLKNTNKFLGYKIVDIGFNYRLSDMSSALGISQLKRIDKFIKKRNIISKKYFNKLSFLKDYIYLPDKKKDVQNAWHLFVLRINFNKLKINRVKFFKLLSSKGVNTQIHYTPIYNQPLFKDLKSNIFKGTEKYFNTCLSIPIYPELSNIQIKHVVNSIKLIINKYKK